MNLQQRIDLLQRLGEYLVSEDEGWQQAKERAFADNHWFLPEFIDLAAKSISKEYLAKENLQQLAERYRVPAENPDPKKVGIVMAGNIPLVGFHDLLCVFITGNKAMIKPSSRDEALVKHIVNMLIEWEPAAGQFLEISGMLKNCDAYIATGSNNSSRYFDYYFSKYPSIIRRNRTSLAVLTGHETREELEHLADDVYLYFGLGCRNVSKILVPENYDFIPLLQAFRKYDYLANHHKFKNNYDYNLAVLILNNRYYMTNDSLILVEDPSLFSPIAQLHYEYYKDEEDLQKKTGAIEELQCVVQKGRTDFGAAQRPGICDYADGVDTMRFLMDLTGQ